MGAYDLPTSLRIGEVDYAIRSGWRAVMDIFSAFADPDMDPEMKTDIMMFYQDFKNQFAVQILMRPFIILLRCFMREKT